MFIPRKGTRRGLASRGKALVQLAALPGFIEQGANRWVFTFSRQVTQSRSRLRTYEKQAKSATNHGAPIRSTRPHWDQKRDSIAIFLSRLESLVVGRFPARPAHWRRAKDPSCEFRSLVRQYWPSASTQWVSFAAAFSAVFAAQLAS